MAILLLANIVGEIEVREKSFEWTVSDFFTLCDKVNDRYRSRDFNFDGSRYSLGLFPNEETADLSEGWVDLFIFRIDVDPPKDFHITLGIKGSNGVESFKELKYDFTDERYGWGFDRFISRSELANRKDTLLPKDVMTVICHLRRDGSSHVEYKKRLEEQVDSANEQIKSLQKAVENYKLETENYEKRINASQIEKSAMEEDYKCLLEEKLITVSGLEKEKEEFQKEVESLKGQVKTLLKRTENYDLVLENCEKQTSFYESEKSIAEEYKCLLGKYKCLLEEKTTVSRLEKVANDELKKDMEYLKEENKVLKEKIDGQNIRYRPQF